MRTIQHLTTALVVTAVLAGVVTSNGYAQRADGTNGAKGSLLALLAWDIMPGDAEALIDKGDELVGSRDYGAARREYAAAVEVIRAAGGFPSLPIRKMADAYYFEKKYQSAIRTLDDLTEEAAEVGDIVTQAWAQADAAWLLDVDCQAHAKSERPGRNLEMKKRANSLRRLLASPYLPAEERTEIINKRCGGCHAK
ncbi:MAG: hypothetical protein JSU87_08215 [Gemmatimonadota bacterium]|nr:MAG: hypothetical protein JSU87_08215 [Gemmatimonadota bacterium]